MNLEIPQKQAKPLDSDTSCRHRLRIFGIEDIHRYRVHGNDDACPWGPTFFIWLQPSGGTQHSLLPKQALPPGSPINLNHFLFKLGFLFLSCMWSSRLYRRGVRVLTVLILSLEHFLCLHSSVCIALSSASWPPGMMPRRGGCGARRRSSGFTCGRWSRRRVAA